MRNMFNLIFCQKEQKTWRFQGVNGHNLKSLGNTSLYQWRFIVPFELDLEGWVKFLTDTGENGELA